MAKSSGVSVQEVADAIQARGLKVKRRGNHWMAQCPCHDDKTASLSLTESRTTGRALAYCFADGCPAHHGGMPALLQELGLSRGNERHTHYIYRSRATKAPATIVERVDAPGEAKTIRQSHLGEDFEPLEERGVPQELLELYGSDTIASARRSGESVYFAEGEKSVDIFHQNFLSAVTMIGGSSSRLSHEQCLDLEGCHVIVWQDIGPAGEEYAHSVATSLRGYAASVKIVKGATTGNNDDIEEHLAAGHDIEDAILVAEFVGTPIIRLVAVEDVKSSKVTWAVPGLVPTGEITIVEGAPDTGKSFMALLMAKQIRKGTVFPNGACSEMGGASTAYIATEDLAGLIRNRADLMGFHDGLFICDDFMGAFTEDNLGIIFRDIASTGARNLILDSGYDLIVSGRDDDDPMHVKPILRRTKSLAAAYGMSVIFIRHVTKFAGRDSDEPHMSDGYGPGHYSQIARSQIRVMSSPDPSLSRVVQVKSNHGVKEAPWFFDKRPPCGWIKTTLAELKRSSAAPVIDAAKAAIIRRGGSLSTDELCEELRSAGLDPKILFEAKKEMHDFPIKCTKLGEDWIWSVKYTTGY